MASAHEVQLLWGAVTQLPEQSRYSRQTSPDHCVLGHHAHQGPSMSASMMAFCSMHYETCDKMIHILSS